MCNNLKQSPVYIHESAFIKQNEKQFEKKIMKKYVIVLVWMAICQTGFAQSAESLFNQFQGEKGVESVSISPFLMKFARLFMDEDDKNNPMIKGINSVQVLDLEESPKEVQERFAKKVKKLKLNGYETWIQVKEDGETVKIVAKVKDDMVRELLILQAGDDGCALVLMKGKIKRNDIQAAIEDDKIKIDGRK